MSKAICDLRFVWLDTNGAPVGHINVASTGSTTLMELLGFLERVTKDGLTIEGTIKMPSRFTPSPIKQYGENHE